MAACTPAMFAEGVVTLSQTERNLPTTANVAARDFKHLAGWSFVLGNSADQMPETAEALRSPPRAYWETRRLLSSSLF
jgi:hypothetical protein